MTACLKEDASACIGMATRLGPGRLKHVDIKHFALQHWVQQGRLTLDKVTATEQVGRHHDKTQLNADVGNIGSEDWPDETYHRSDGT